MKFPVQSVRHAAAIAGVVSAVAGAGWVGCTSRSGDGGSPGYDSSATLVGIAFPDPNDVNPEADFLPPSAAPLVQQIVFDFSGRPDPAQVSQDTLSVRDLSGIAVEGRFDVNGTRVTFTPRLPVRAPAAGLDGGGAGLAPGTAYQVHVSPGAWDFLQAVATPLLVRFGDPSAPGSVALTFQTTTVPADFFRGLPRRRPRLVRSSPADGAVGVTPQLYTDPRGMFPPRAAFLLEFDAPVHPDPSNLAAFRLTDLEDHGGPDPSGLSLGIDVCVLTNELERSVVQVFPSGILPFGHLLALESPVELRGLSQARNPGAATQVAATFQVAAGTSAPMADALVEDFDTQERRDQDPALLAPGESPAQWDFLDSGYLQASLAFGGSGALGRFVPHGPGGPSTRLLYLDTSRQELPLFDGSTPDARPNTVVVGGVFDFTDIDIPSGVILQPVGPNPLVLTATGSVRIAGTIHARAANGLPEFLFDSATHSLAGGLGGAGGGRGGEAQPLLFLGNVVTLTSSISPPRGGRGWGPRDRERIGGEGGQCGMRDHPDLQGLYGTDLEFDCKEIDAEKHKNEYKAPGGGGGSFLHPGTRALRDGRGNVLADGLGGFIVRTPEKDGPDYAVLAAGNPGAWPFGDGDPGNDFIGARGEVPAVQGGQGGGAGGSALDSYYCGYWCRRDGNPLNDMLCEPEFGDPPTLGDSVGDARGGSAGGGGGAVQLRALGPIVLESSALIDCGGGSGGGGESIGCGTWGGCGAGGSGGAVLLESAQSLTLNSGATLDVAGGVGSGAFRTDDHPGNASCNKFPDAVGAGGDGAIGLIQLQTPAGTVPSVSPGARLTAGARVDPTNTLNPAELTPVSRAVSRWYDLGRVITRPPAGTRPSFRFRGVDPATGRVLTDSEGYVVNPDHSDIRVDYLGQIDPQSPGGYVPGQEPRANFIPLNASVVVEFQGARAMAPGSKEVDPASVTPWSAQPAVADGMQFLRYRITFDVAVGGQPLAPRAPVPTVQEIRIHADF